MSVSLLKCEAASDRAFFSASASVCVGFDLDWELVLSGTEVGAAMHRGCGPPARSSSGTDDH